MPPVVVVCCLSCLCRNIIENTISLASRRLEAASIAKRSKKRACSVRVRDFVRVRVDRLKNLCYDTVIKRRIRRNMTTRSIPKMNDTNKVKCLNPRKAWICGVKYCKADGVLSQNLVFSPLQAYNYFYCLVQDSILRPDFGRDAFARKKMRENETEVCCGHCAICLIQKRKDMSVRLAHEASQHEDCCFLTLTYDEENLPCISKVMEKDDLGRNKCYTVQRGCDWECPIPTLLPLDVQKFMKRLRRHLEYVPKKMNDGRDHINGHLRYFAVGEYGSRTHRPHYHIIIFGWKPSDLKLHMMKDGRPVYRSAQVEKLWTFGFSSVCEVSPYVAKYAARYVTKKYARLGKDDREEVRYQLPEFTLQSTRDGGVGATWFDKFGEAACQVGLCTLRVGERIAKCAIPKYYWNRLRKRNLPLWLKCRDEKIEFVKNHKSLGYTVADLIRKAEVELEACKYFEGKETF